MKTMSKAMMTSILLAATPAFAGSWHTNQGTCSKEFCEQNPNDPRCASQQQYPQQGYPQQGYPQQQYPDQDQGYQHQQQYPDQDQDWRQDQYQQQQYQHQPQFDPWNPQAQYAPPPRPGYVWVPGRYDPRGDWIPGYYRPIQTRAGYVWEPGYWRGGVYIDGFWRPESRPGWVWIPGHYAARGKWIEGHWARG